MQVDLKERLESIARQCQNACDNLAAGPLAHEQAVRAFQNIKFVAERASTTDPRPGAGDASGARKTIAKTIWKFERCPDVNMTEAQQDFDWRRMRGHYEECADAILSALSASPAATRGDEFDRERFLQDDSKLPCRIDEAPPVPAPAPADGERELLRDLVASLNKRGRILSISHDALSPIYKRAEALLATPPAARSEPAAEMLPIVSALLRVVCISFDSGGESMRSQRAQALEAAWHLITRDEPAFEQARRECDADTWGFISRARLATPEAPGAQEETL